MIHAEIECVKELGRPIGVSRNILDRHIITDLGVKHGYKLESGNEVIFYPHLTYIR